MRIRLLFCALCMLLPSSSWAAPEAARPLEAPVKDDGFAPFLTSLRTAVAKGDRAKFADLCLFPMRSYELAGAIAKATQKPLKPGEDRPQLDPEIDRPTLLRHYALFLDATAKRNLLKLKPIKHDGQESGQHWYSVGMKAGKTWSAWFVFAANEAGTWKLVGTDNVSN